jgi:cytochrome oxidase Cu insertion factor (SCO1/SenC/PrrC family)
LLAATLSAGLVQAAEGEDEIARAREYFTNLELVNQDGESMRFFDDVLKDKVVLISFIFTNCEGACPLITYKMTQVRDRMESYVGQPLHFISLSIDPERDTPAALKEFAQTHDAYQDAWTFLTGKPEVIKEITSRLGQYTDNVEAHSTLMLAGNVNEAHWMKIPPQDQAPAIVEKLRTLLEDSES